MLLCGDEESPSHERADDHDGEDRHEEGKTVGLADY
jgi:hypothetical protein